MSQVNEPTLNSPCFCGSPCKEHLSRLKCGVELDYTAINDSIKNVKGRGNKDHILNGTPLGCKLYINKKDYQHLPPRLFSLPLKAHPKCHHHLYAQTIVSHSEQNKNRALFTCPVQYPDTSCYYFEWADDVLPSTTPEYRQEVLPLGSKRPRYEQEFIPLGGKRLREDRNGIETTPSTFAALKHSWYNN